MKMQQMWKKITGLCVVCCLMLGLSGCNAHGYGVMEAGKINIVCTTFPLYDWTMKLAGEDNRNVNVTLLIANGADAHSYQATARDIAMLSSCDVLVYVGGESDQWVEDAIQSTYHEKRQIVRLMDYLEDRVLVEEIVDGMQHEHGDGFDHEDAHNHAQEHDHEEGHDHEEEHEHEGEHEEYDEHVWLSLRNAQIMCRVLEDVLCRQDAAQTGRYHTNADAYCEELDALDEKMCDIVSKSSKDTLIFGDRFPFRYWMEDYGLQYYAAFPGCSAESEASFETITFLAKKMDETKSDSILILENSGTQIAQTIIDNTEKKNQSIVCLDSMQAVTGKQIKEGISYLQIMKQNVDLMEQVLAD